MTAIQVQRGRHIDPVTVTDDAVEISHLRVTHPETVAIARRELAEHGPAALNTIYEAVGPTVLTDTEWDRLVGWSEQVWSGGLVGLMWVREQQPDTGR